jgi:hypothetical protein
MMGEKKPLNLDGLNEIMNYKAALNNGLTPLLKESFPNCVPLNRLPELDNVQVPNPN